MQTVAEWVASIPEQISPRDGLTYIALALADAKEATAEIRAKFSGTVPPPPWPQPPELVSAIDALEGGQLMLNQAIQLGYGDRKEPRTGPHSVRLINGGRALYAGIEKMRREHREGVITPANIPRKAASALAALLSTPVGGVVALGVVLYFLGDE